MGRKRGRGRVITKAVVPSTTQGNRTARPQARAIEPRQFGLMEALNEATGGGWSANPLARDPFDLVPFGPGNPLAPQAINPPRRDSDRPEPRLWDYPTSWNIPGTTQREISWEVLRAASVGVDIIRRCIEIRKKHVRSLKWAFSVSADAIQEAYAADPRRGKEDAEFQLRDRLTPEIRRLTQRWRRPWPSNDLNMGQWLNMLMEELLVGDAVPVYPRTNLMGDVLDLEIIDPSTIKLLLDQRGARPMAPHPFAQQVLKGFPRGEWAAEPLVDENGKTVIDQDGNPVAAPGLTADQLYYYRENVRTHSPYGLSPVEMALISAKLYLQRQGWMLAEYTDGSTPLTWVKPPLETPGAEAFTPRQRRVWEDSLNDELAGQTRARHRVKVPPPGWDPVQMKSADEQYKPEYDLHLIKLLASHFGVTISELGFTEAKGLGSSGFHQGQQAVEDRVGLRPDTVIIAEIINDLSRRFFGMPAEVEFAFIDPATQDEKTVDDVAHQRFLDGRITLNEARKAVGQPLLDFPEADMPMFAAGQSGPVPWEGLVAAMQAQQQANVAALQAKANPPADGADGQQDAPAGDSGDNSDEAPPQGDDVQKAAELRAYARWTRRNAGRARQFVFKAVSPFDFPGGVPDDACFADWEWVPDEVITKALTADLIKRYESWWPRDKRGRWIARAHLSRIDLGPNKPDADTLGKLREASHSAKKVGGHRSEIASLHRAAEESDLAAHRAKVKREAVDRRPLSNSANRAEFNRKIKDARQLDEEQMKHRAQARKHREAADKLRAQGATPEDRATISELGAMAADAKAQGRHEDAARAFAKRAERLRAGESGWTLNPPSSRGESVLTGERGASQGFPSRKQAEQWRAEADATTAGIAEHEAEQQRKLAEAHKLTVPHARGTVEDMTSKPSTPEAPRTDTKPRIETYKGRKIKVRKNPKQWGTLETSINGQVIGTPVGTRPEDLDKHVEQLKKDIDFADLRRHDDPTAYADYMYRGAPEPTAEETAHAREFWARERADRAAMQAPSAPEAPQAKRELTPHQVELLQSQIKRNQEKIERLKSEHPAAQGMGAITEGQIKRLETQIREAQDALGTPSAPSEEDRIQAATAKADALHEEWKAAEDRFNAATDAAYEAGGEDEELNATADKALAEEKAARDAYHQAETDLHHAGAPKRERERAERDAAFSAAVERQQAEREAKAAEKERARQAAAQDRLRQEAMGRERQERIKEQIKAATPQAYAKLLGEEDSPLKLTHAPSIKIVQQMRAQGWVATDQHGILTTWEAPDGRTMTLYRTSKGGLQFGDPATRHDLTLKDAAEYVGSAKPTEAVHTDLTEHSSMPKVPGLAPGQPKTREQIQADAEAYRAKERAKIEQLKARRQEYLDAGRKRDKSSVNPINILDQQIAHHESNIQHAERQVTPFGQLGIVRPTAEQEALMAAEKEAKHSSMPSGPTPQEHLDALGGMRTRAEADAYLAKLKRPELSAIIEHRDAERGRRRVPVSATAKAMRENLAGDVGARAGHEALYARALGKHPATPAGVRAAYAEVQREQAGQTTEWTSLADIRDKLTGTRAEQDAAIRAFEQMPDTNVIPTASPRTLTQRTSEASIRIGNQDKHFLTVIPQEDVHKAASIDRPALLDEVHVMAQASGYDADEKRAAAAALDDTALVALVKAARAYRGH